MRTAASHWTAPKRSASLYFPLASEAGLKSCVSPDLGGDAKLDQETFLLEPVSVENLHNNRSTRNFWLAGANGTALSPYRRVGAPAGGEVHPRPGRQPPDGGLYVAHPGAHTETGGGACHPDQLCAGEGQCGSAQRHGGKHHRQHPHLHPLRGGAPLRPQRRQPAGSPQRDFHAPPAPHHRPRGAGLPHHVL